MRRINLLQVGDVHYPQWLTRETEVDIKDRAFSKEIIRDLQFNSIHSVLLGLNRIIHKTKIDGVVLVGDLTSYGDHEKLRQAVKHLNLLCRPTVSANYLPEMIVVPGNHDVNKNDIQQYGSLQKFELLRELCHQYGWSSPPINEAYRIELGADASSKLHLILVNTSAGCWDPHFIPPIINEQLADDLLNLPPVQLIDPRAAELHPAVPESIIIHPDATRFQQVYNQMDTPYMPAGTLDSLSELVAQIPQREQIIIVGHHNILPQKTPRISHYSEMLNAGFVRRELLALNRRIIYLHGHIHQDPVEIVSDPHFPRSRIICISAPQMLDGFNELSFFFDRATRPIGVRLTQHRVDRDGRLKRFEKQEQVFISLREGNNVLLEKTISDLFQELRAIGLEHSMNVFSWTDLLEVTGNNQIKILEDDLEDAVISLHSARLVRIENIGRVRDEWRVNLEMAS